MKVNHFIKKNKKETYMAVLNIMWLLIINFKWASLYDMIKNLYFSKDVAPVYAIFKVNQEQLDYFSNIEKTYMVRLLRRYRKLFKKNLVVMTKLVKE